MKKSLSVDTIFQELPFYDRFRQIREAGFDYCELGVWTDLDITKVQRLMQECHLAISLMAGDRDHSLILPEEHEEFLEYLSQSFAVAKAFGCRNLVLHSNAVSEDGSMSLAGAAHSDFTKVAAATKVLLDASKIAAKNNITLLLKPISSYCHPGAFITTTPAAGDVVRVVNSPYLKMLYDVSQMQEMEGNIANMVRKYRDCIGYIQIGDLTGSPEDSEVNLAVFRSLLDEVKYDGMVGFRFQPQPESSDACLRAIRAF